MRGLPPENDPSFLGRLAAAGKAREWNPDTSVPPVPEIDARTTIPLIVRNLRHVLGSRKRYDCARPDFGLGDYDDPRHIDRTIRTLVSEVRDAVVRFEPRLRSPRVLALSHDERLRIQLSITGTVLGQPCRLKVQIETLTRRVLVEED